LKGEVAERELRGGGESCGIIGDVFFGHAQGRPFASRMKRGRTKGRGIFGEVGDLKEEKKVGSAGIRHTEPFRGRQEDG
jgi:hypothetical protein